MHTIINGNHPVAYQDNEYQFQRILRILKEETDTDKAN